jgi:hypothetical protein
MVLFVNLTAMRDTRYTDEFRRVVYDIYTTPVTDADAPMVLGALRFFVSCGAWSFGESSEFADDAGQHGIRQHFEFLTHWRL